MEKFNADYQDSSATERIEDVFALPDQTSSSFYHVEPFVSEINHVESLSLEADQDITSDPFFGQSGGVSYGRLHYLFLFHW